MIPLGIFLHAVGGFAAGSFYLPLCKIKGWAWESGWLINGIFSWLIAPIFVAWLIAPNPPALLHAVPTGTIFWTYFFGVLWGIGGLTFGLSCRYLGLSLGYAVALGFCAFFGTIVPPIYDGTFGDISHKPSGLVLLFGLAVCLVGIAICGIAGRAKERELSKVGKNNGGGEFSFLRGILVALFAGAMSSCMAFAFRAGDPIAKLATEHGVTDLWKNTPVLIVILAGGFTTNAIWCLVLNIRNRSVGDYLGRSGGPTRVNYLLAAVAGVTWYLQFMFYGMGTTKMGAYNFSSWTLHMAFIIVFSNLWGIRLGEWREVHQLTRKLLIAGIAVVFLSTLVVGVSNYMASLKN
jgi:L-rhamnose-H+ transport protein